MLAQCIVFLLQSLASDQITTNLLGHIQLTYFLANFQKPLSLFMFANLYIGLKNQLRLLRQPKLAKNKPTVH